MPISKERMKLYPGGSIHSKEWKELRASILYRAGHRCEGTPAYPDCRAENYKPHPVTGSKVVLTIMHLDHDPTNNDYKNLKAGCQRCHNKYDAPFRKKNAAITRRRKSPQVDIEDYLSTTPPHKHI